MKREKTSSVVEKIPHLPPQVSPDTVRVIAEAAGIANLSDDACRYLSDDVTYRLKNVIELAEKFHTQTHSPRLMCDHVDRALKMKNAEPVLGYCGGGGDLVPFKHASGGGREVHYNEESEVDVHMLINDPPPKVPYDVCLKAHWVSIEGVQPATPDNPPLVSKEEQRAEAVDPSLKAKHNKLAVEGAKQPELVQLKNYSTHELSVEQQMYYKEITEACMGADEARRAEALNSLSSDPVLHQMMPRFSAFISEGVKTNVVQQNNLALLIYLMRMIKSLLDNPALYLERYLHELVPAVVTCIVSKQLCLRPEVDNHWALRDFASRLLGQMCKTFTTTSNNLQARLTRQFHQVISNPSAPLASHYGVVSALGELGPEVCSTFLLPHLKQEDARIRGVVESGGVHQHSVAERTAADHLRTNLCRVASQALRHLRPGGGADDVDDYREEFGPLLGPQLLSAVQKARQSGPTSSTTAGGGPAQARGSSSSSSVVRQASRPPAAVGRQAGGATTTQYVRVISGASGGGVATTAAAQPPAPAGRILVVQTQAQQGIVQVQQHHQQQHSDVGIMEDSD